MDVRKRRVSLTGEVQDTTKDKKPSEINADSKYKYRKIAKYSAASVFVILLTFVIWPSDLCPKAFIYKTPPAFSGPLAVNNLLSESRKLYEGLVNGPESIAFNNGHLYTGTSDGNVLDIYNGEIRVLARFGSNPCGSGDSEKTCGRPLGVRMMKSGKLLVVDCTLGLYQVDTDSGRYKQLISSNDTLAGYKPKFLNDVVVSSSGMIYVTDGSVRWGRTQFKMQGLQQNPDGRILEYNPVTKETTVVCDGVYPNGIEVSADEDYVIICETSTVRLLKCYIRGEKRGKIEVFMENLPGYPDNIRRSTSGGYWVALTAVRQSNLPAPVWEKLGPYPFIRDLMYKWDSIQSWIPFSRRTPGVKPRKTYGLIIEVSEFGEYQRSLHDPMGKIVSISHVQENNGKLFLGSATNNYIGMLKLQEN